ERFRPVMELASRHGVRVRGYVSCVVGCPYEGEVAPAKVAEVTQALLDLGVYEVSLGDTIGVGTPNKVAAMLDAVLKMAPAERLAIHCHDTYGQALVNIHEALRSEEHTSELQSRENLVCRLLLVKKQLNFKSQPDACADGA